MSRKMTTGPHPHLEVIDHDDCLRLLAGDEIGRLAVIAGNTAVVVPVNYALDGETVVFRTDPGTKLDQGPRARASFEVDRFDRERRTGWSVVATGRLEEVTLYDAATFERVRHLAVDPWAGGDKAHWMRLIPDRVTGRRVGERARRERDAGGLA
ncbi:MAG TPA: pyridoxamine 5'-phosphate oxidase family protein [Acidimicrobiales bacterium]|nr:pyridoxamine 5'-phosphate oxidase family protein [Acidimicrobiales bacterium]